MTVIGRSESSESQPLMRPMRCFFTAMSAINSCRNARDALTITVLVEPVRNNYKAKQNNSASVRIPQTLHLPRAYARHRQEKETERCDPPSFFLSRIQTKFSMTPIPAPALAAVAAVLLPLLMVLADPSDESCLLNLRASLDDPANILRNWTKSTFASPCNGFTSYLEGVTCNNGRIYKLSLPGRALGGSISPFLSNCTNLQTLDLSSNALTGPIPAELSSLLNLAVLNLSSNHLSGQIPPQLAFCAYLNVIDLHSNDLSGPIPDQLGLLVRLSSFDVSYNHLEGPIPALLANRTALPRFNASSFVGNRELYGYPLPPVSKRGLSVLAIIGIGLGSGMLSLVLSFSAVCIWLRATEQNNAAAGGAANSDDVKASHLTPDY